MGTYIYLVMTNPVAGKEDEYVDWYGSRHLADVVRETGCTSATHYRLAPMEPAQSSAFKYAAVYEIETDDPAEMNATLVASFGSPAMPLSDALDLTSLSAAYFEQIARA
ncbi:MAG: hypothetical protein ACYDH6_01385 [Acidimicrobiales bacterium]